MSIQVEQEASGRAPEPKEEPYPPAGYAWYVVGVLTLVYVFSFIDRQILSLLVAPIKRDLAISDTQLSLLMGTSFAIFYTFFGIPLGRLADSRSRRSIIAAGFVFWSLTTAALGIARTFIQMLLLRMGVGLGQAALSPAAYSLITDYFPRNRVATAISVYSMGIYIGSGLALILGGVVVGFARGQETWVVPLLGEIRPWQIIFLIVGLPGVLLALLMYTVKEPIRRGVKRVAAAAGTKPQKGVPLSEIIAYLRENRLTFICHNLGFAFISLSNYGSSAWIPAFFNRIHGWPESTAGLVYGTIVMISGTLGIVAGGRLADWMSDRGRRDSTMRVAFLVTLGWMVPGMLFPLVPDGGMAAALLVPAVFLTSAPFGVAAAAIQQMMPNSMRGQASAIYLFVVNLIGLGLGPTAIAIMTNYVFRDDYALNYSILTVATVTHILAAGFLYIGLKPYRESLDRLDKWTRENT